MDATNVGIVFTSAKGELDVECYGASSHSSSSSDSSSRSSLSSSSSSRTSSRSSGGQRVLVQAMVCDGNNDFARINANPPELDIDLNVSVAIWYNLTTLQSQGEHLMGKAIPNGGGAPADIGYKLKTTGTSNNSRLE